jgi:hypothetical protein
LVLLPTAYWNVVHLAEFLARAHKFGIGSQHGHLAAAAIGAGEFIMGVFDFAVLPALISALAFAAAGLRFSERHPKAPAKEHLLWRSLAFGLAMLAILVLASGATEIRSRWLLPVLLVLPLATAAYMERLGPRGRIAQSLVIAAGAIIAILSMVASWYFQVNGGDGQAGILRMNYASLYRDLTADGPVKTIVSDKPFIGNLRLLDKSLVTLDDEMPDFGSLLREPVVMVWLNKDAPDKSILDQIGRAGYVTDGETHSVQVPEFRSNSGRHVVFVRLKKTGQTGSSGN